MSVCVRERALNTVLKGFALWSRTRGRRQQVSAGGGGGEGSSVGVGGNPEGPLCASRAGRASVRPGGRPVWHSMSASKASRSLTTSGCRFS